MQFVDMTGKRFGRLTVIAVVSRGAHPKIECLCDCGVRKILFATNVVRGLTKSCGCYRKEVSKSQIRNKGNRKHSLCYTRFYRIFSGLKQRCTQANRNCFKNYGGRGIKCLWKSFEEFKEDMYKPYLDHVARFGEAQTTIDRVNNDGNYCKENCRWSTRSEQQFNRRKQ